MPHKHSTNASMKVGTTVSFSNRNSVCLVQIKTVLELRNKNIQRKLAEDQEELEKARKAVEKNKADQERKRNEAVVQMQATLAENRKYISAKHEASRLQAEKDEAMMKV